MFFNTNFHLFSKPIFRLSKDLSYLLVFSTSYGKFDKFLAKPILFSNLFNFVFSFINRKFSLFIRDCVALNISGFDCMTGFDS